MLKNRKFFTISTIFSILFTMVNVNATQIKKTKEASQTKTSTENTENVYKTNKSRLIDVSYGNISEIKNTEQPKENVSINFDKTIHNQDNFDSTYELENILYENNNDSDKKEIQYLLDLINMPKDIMEIKEFLINEYSNLKEIEDNIYSLSDSSHPIYLKLKEIKKIEENYINPIIEEFYSIKKLLTKKEKLNDNDNLKKKIKEIHEIAGFFEKKLSDIIYLITKMKIEMCYDYLDKIFKKHAKSSEISNIEGMLILIKKNINSICYLSQVDKTKKLNFEDRIICDKYENLLVKYMKTWKAVVTNKIENINTLLTGISRKYVEKTNIQDLEYILYLITSITDFLHNVKVFLEFEIQSNSSTCTEINNFIKQLLSKIENFQNYNLQIKAKILDRISKINNDYNMLKKRSNEQYKLTSQNIAQNIDKFDNEIENQKHDKNLLNHTEKRLKENVNTKVLDIKKKKPKKITTNKRINIEKLITDINELNNKALEMIKINKNKDPLESKKQKGELIGIKNKLNIYLQNNEIYNNSRLKNIIQRLLTQIKENIKLIDKKTLNSLNCYNKKITKTVKKNKDTNSSKIVKDGIMLKNNKNVLIIEQYKKELEKLEKKCHHIDEIIKKEKKANPSSYVYIKQIPKKYAKKK